MGLFDGEPLTEYEIQTHGQHPKSVCLHDEKGRPTRRRPYHVDYGLGPEGQTCGDCAFLYRRKAGAHVYMKCNKHPMSFGPGTDIAQKDAACKFFEPAPSSPTA